jgi:hypothetical protein
MALTSVFYDGVVTETDRAKSRGGVPDYGVYGVDDFKVTAHPSIGYAVLVKAGKAHGFGVTDTATTDQVVNCATISSGTRWDLIVVRRNWQPALGGPSTLAVVQGGTKMEIPAGRKIGPGVEDDQPIALVKWKAGLLAPDTIIDLRVWASNGGLFAKDDMVRSYLTGIGTRVNINGVDWARTLGANGVPEWNSSAVATYAPLGVSGYSLTGTIAVEPAGAKRRVTVDINVKRTGATGEIPSASFANFGAVIPSAARGNSGVTKYLPVAISGGTNNNHATVALDTDTGVMSIRGQAKFNLTTLAMFTLNATYYI